MEDYFSHAIETGFEPQHDGLDDDRMKKNYQKHIDSIRSIDNTKNNIDSIDIDVNKLNIDSIDIDNTSPIREIDIESIIDEVDEIKNNDSRIGRLKVSIDDRERIADMLITKLDEADPIKSKPFYLRLAGEMTEAILMRLAGTTCEMPGVRNKGAYFNRLVQTELQK